MMNKTINNEKGFVLIASLLMLVVLMIIGIAATNTTTIELQISGNDKVQKMNFYVAESGWQRGVEWLNTIILDGEKTKRTVAPSRVNTSISEVTDSNYSLVRNYGDGTNNVLNDGFSSNEDGTLTDQNIPYWYRVDYVENVKIAGGGGEYRNYIYLITSVADGQQAVEVRVEKPFKSGY